MYCPTDSTIKTPDDDLLHERAAAFTGVLEHLALLPACLAFQPKADSPSLASNRGIVEHPSDPSICNMETRVALAPKMLVESFLVDAILPDALGDNLVRNPGAGHNRYQAPVFVAGIEFGPASHLFIRWKYCGAPADLIADSHLCSPSIGGDAGCLEDAQLRRPV